MSKSIELEVNVADGKYTYRFYKDGSSEVLRRGHPWRSAIGDSFLLAMAQRIDHLTKALEAQDAEYGRLKARVDDLATALTVQDHSKTVTVPYPERPVTCRNALRDAGLAYPKSGCAVCKNGGMMGCPYETH